jgi:hypothetical protein
MEEVWLDIPDYEGIYQASNLGRIRTAPNKTTYTELRGVRHWKTRILKYRGQNYKTGFRVSLWKDGKQKDWLVARLVAITFLGMPTENKNTVNHIDGNRFNNKIENLEWLSLADNIRHAFDSGLMPYPKIRLYNANTDKTFRSKTSACEFLGKSHKYIYNCLRYSRPIMNKYGEQFFVEVLDN